MNSAKPTIRHPAEGTNGRYAIRGMIAIRPMVMLLGRFTLLSRLGECLQNQLAHCLEGFEDTIAGNCHCLEICRPFHPFAGGGLLDELLPRVVGVGSHPLLCRL